MIKKVTVITTERGFQMLEEKAAPMPLFPTCWSKDEYIHKDVVLKAMKHYVDHVLGVYRPKENFNAVEFLEQELKDD